MDPISFPKEYAHFGDFLKTFETYRRFICNSQVAYFRFQ